MKEVFLIARNAVFYALKAFANVRANLFASAMSVFTLTLCLVLLGVFLVLLRGAQNLLPNWMTGMKVVAYLHPDTAAQDQDRLARELSAWPEIEHVEAVSREQAWERLKSQLQQWQDILEGIEENPLPPSLEIAFKTEKRHLADMESLVANMRQLPEVEEVYYGKIWMEKLESFLSMIKILGGGLTGLFALVSILIVSNTIKLTVFARRDELEIYRIVGATPQFIRIPFYFEGVIQGVIGTVAALLALSFLIYLASETMPLPLAAAFSYGAGEKALLATVLLAMGVTLGWLGSWLALRRFLRV